MKKALASVLAGAMMLSMSSVAFAAGANPGAVSGDPVSGSGSNKKTESDYYVQVTPDDDNGVFEGFGEIYTWGEEDTDPYSEIKVAIVPNKLNGNSFDKKFSTYKITDIEAHVNTDNVSASVRKNDGGLAISETEAGNAPVVTIKAKAGVRDFDLDDWEVEVDMTIGELSADGKVSNKDDITITLKQEDGVAYSLTQEIQSDEKYSISKANGSICDFDEVIDEETRIRANEYVDVFFKGNYGTDKENMRVVTDEIAEVAEFFGDVDVDYYDFIGTPKFASKVKVTIDADPGTSVYEYDKSTGDLTKLDVTYESDAWAFTTKNLGTYIITEEEYEAGNVEEEEKEPEEEPEDTTTEDTSSDKVNPGTGASDMVGVTAALAVVSLIAAGSIAYKKVSK